MLGIKQPCGTQTGYSCTYNGYTHHLIPVWLGVIGVSGMAQLEPVTFERASLYRTNNNGFLALVNLCMVQKCNIQE